MQMYKFIAIEGVIGVGKTTLARLLKPHFEAEVLLEVFEENPFLADFYSDRDRYAFQTQLFFLLSRYQQQKNAVPVALQQNNLISDYTFAKDELFAWLNLKDDELSMYGRVHSALGEKIRQPDLLVYLHAEHEAVMQRIALRDRPYERDMDPAYIRQLAAAYEAWLANLIDIPVLKLDMTRRDVLTREEDLNFVVEAVQQALGGDKSAPLSPAESRAPAPQKMPVGNTLGNYQELHRHLDRANRFDPDLFSNSVGLMAEVGELSSILNQIWTLRLGMEKQGQAGEAALHTAVQAHRAAVGKELADIMAYLLKIANYIDLDLEEAFVTKMKENIDEQW